jgi:hypothetical protein
VENKEEANQVNEFCKCSRTATHKEEEISDGKNTETGREREREPKQFKIS